MQRPVNLVLILKVIVIDVVTLDTDFDPKQAGAMRGATRPTGQGLGTSGAVGKFASITPFISFGTHLFILVLGEGHSSGHWHTEHRVPFPMQDGSQEHKSVLRGKFL